MQDAERALPGFDPRRRGLAMALRPKPPPTSAIAASTCGVDPRKKIWGLNITIPNRDSASQLGKRPT